MAENNKYINYYFIAHYLNITSFHISIEISLYTHWWEQFQQEK